MTEKKKYIVQLETDMQIFGVAEFYGPFESAALAADFADGCLPDPIQWKIKKIKSGEGGA